MLYYTYTSYLYRIGYTLYNYTFSNINQHIYKEMIFNYIIFCIYDIYINIVLEIINVLLE